MPTSHGKKRITIIGTGLIGGSLGLALKAAAPVGVEIVGHDSDRSTASKAEKAGAIDRAEHNLPRAVDGAGMVVIAVPVLSVREVMQQIAPDLAEGALVTDTTSTKAHVMAWAKDTLPEHVNFVGGHPMAGKENAGIENAEPGLFRGRAYCVCPAVDASESAVRSVLGLARLAGAEPMFMDADEHDIYAAAVSHLPLMMSTALFSMLRSSPAWTDMGMMASSGFRDVTRLASGDPAMSHGIWVTNREAVIHWLERMSEELKRYRDMLKDAQDEVLLETFYRAQADRAVFLAEPPRRQSEASIAKVDTGEAMLSMLVGGMMAKNIKRAKEIPELTGETPQQPGVREETKRRRTFGEKVAEGIKRDLEKLEQQRADKQAKPEQPGDDGA
ncbi:MAG TPA: prephenate dehydrogenase/arogenate dehydrogenase family protein [Dehalococcoidia bacterium]|nr:prephenate dehydrogenase/arogenate dehydrogenase family protein [Dehalococcoidia bacterium]